MTSSSAVSTSRQEFRSENVLWGAGERGGGIERPRSCSRAIPCVGQVLAGSQSRFTRRDSLGGLVSLEVALGRREAGRVEDMVVERVRSARAWARSSKATGDDSFALHFLETFQVARSGDGTSCTVRR